MEDWDFVDEHELEGWKGGVVCMTVSTSPMALTSTATPLWPATSVKNSCTQGDHLKKRCKLWAPTWQQQFGWAAEG